MMKLAIPEMEKDEIFKSLKAIEMYQRCYDPYTGRFFIPLEDIGYKESMGILLLIRNGYAMSLCREADGYSVDSYCIYSLEDDTGEYRKVTSCGNILYDLLHKNKVHYFTEMSLQEYMDNELYQKAIDSVLGVTPNFKYWVNGYTIAMVCDGENLKFIEVLEPCV